MRTKSTSPFRVTAGVATELAALSVMLAGAGAFTMTATAGASPLTTDTAIVAAQAVGGPADLHGQDARKRRCTPTEYCTAY